MKHFGLIMLIPFVLNHGDSHASSEKEHSSGRSVVGLVIRSMNSVCWEKFDVPPRKFETKRLDDFISSLAADAEQSVKLKGIDAHLHIEVDDSVKNRMIRYHNENEDESTLPWILLELALIGKLLIVVEQDQIRVLDAFPVGDVWALAPAVIVESYIPTSIVSRVRVPSINFEQWDLIQFSDNLEIIFGDGDPRPYPERIKFFVDPGLSEKRFSLKSDYERIMGDILLEIASKGKLLFLMNDRRVILTDGKDGLKEPD
jgi:hypothetical protein